jgi:hypothetical protein
MTGRANAHGHCRCLLGAVAEQGTEDEDGGTAERTIIATIHTRARMSTAARGRLLLREQFHLHALAT